MRRRKLAALLLVLVGMPAFWLALESAVPNGTRNDWKLTSQSSGVALYSRPRPDSSLKEFKAVGEIEAPARAVHNVIDDLEAYPSFMPFTAECRILKRDPNSILAYQRLSPKICSDRDYTLRIRTESWPGQGGLVYLNRWEPANELGPAEKRGVLRVKLCEGSWLLEPQGPTKTRATYSIYTDSGGAIPAFIANAASEVGIRRLFAAVRKQVKLSKYDDA
jgi:hypothetical protein